MITLCFKVNGRISFKADDYNHYHTTSFFILVDKRFVDRIERFTDLISFRKDNDNIWYIGYAEKEDIEKIKFILKFYDIDISYLPFRKALKDLT